MTIAVVGSGLIGATLARRFVEVGHEVVVSNSRGPESLRELVAELGERAQAADVTEAARAGEVVLVAIPLRAVADLPAEPFAGRIVIDANNYYPSRDGRIAALDDGELTSSELLARHLPDARVVKAFNTVFYRRLAEEGRPDSDEAERLAVPIAGDDAEAKAAVAELIRAIGFAPVDGGGLVDGSRRQQPGTPVYNEPLTPAEARERLGLGP